LDGLSEKSETDQKEEALMERIFQKKSGGISNERFVAGSQNGGAIAPRLASMARGRYANLKGLQHKAQERKRLALLGRRAAVLAHEVANPLHGISVGLEVVKRDLESAEFDVRLLIATLQRTMLEIDRLGSLLNEFRYIACPQDIDFQKTDLVKNTKEVLSCQCDAYRKLGITVELQFDNPLLPVMADADKLKQVVLNLCNNAVEAMPDGGCLTIKGYYLAQKVVLEISDTGTGLPKGLDVFELFRTTKPGGTGVGLPLARQIISAHNGTINYTTEQGHGTTFRISLPAADLGF
jgi:signal transduction histidine kinase